MTLSKREESILSSVIDYYITVGEPVGSRFLQARLPFVVSTATIRNETAYLSELGFLEQPHTSAGKVPTALGYRYYVQNLMPRLTLNNGEMFRILSGIDHSQGDAERLLKNACTVLTEITGLTSAATPPSSAGATIAGIQAVPVGKTSALVVVTTSNGMLKSRIAKLDDGMDYDLLRLFYGVTGANFVGLTVGELTKARLQNAVTMLGGQALRVLPLLVCMYEAANEADRADAIAVGKSAMLNYRELAANAPKIIDILQNTDSAYKLLRQENPTEGSIKIGKETGFAALNGAAVITAPYQIGENQWGSIGVIAPQRTDYAHILPIVEYTAMVTGKLIAQNCKSR